MDKKAVGFLLLGAILLDIVLDLMGIKIPQLVLLLVGFGIRHIQAVDPTVNAKPVAKPVVKPIVPAKPVAKPAVAAAKQ